MENGRVRKTYLRHLLIAGAAWLTAAPSQLAVAQAVEETSFFLIVDGSTLALFEFPVTSRTVTVERGDQCIQKITTNDAEILVFDLAAGVLLAAGQGSLVVRATVDCDTGFYTYERAVVRGGGIVVSPATGEEFRLKVIATASNGEIILLTIALDPV
ncbi:MAG: hypothetical protein DCC67_19730 [Planctomycetota bacterium]|nr:MAG: hypothetical protein DCC67_19730 [Planctomycetota bacterium]